jgi:hypothetical protein
MRRTTLVLSFRENASLMHPTLNVLPTCITARTGDATRMRVILSDDVDYEHTNCRISDSRICSTGSTAECL